MPRENEGKAFSLDVDTVSICAGQGTLSDFFGEVDGGDVSSELIGGAFEAAELNAKAAINRASWSAAKL